MKADNRDVQRISNLAKGYDRNLCGKDFLICYGEEGNTRMLEVAFSKKRFNHLVGIDIGQCHVKPWVLYKKALAGTLTPRDLGSSLSQYFPSKALAASMMNLFASSATHVSKVDPLSTRVNAEIWISGDAAEDVHSESLDHICERASSAIDDAMDDSRAVGRSEDIDK